MKNKEKEEVLSDLILNEDFEFTRGEYTIKNASAYSDYGGDKDFVVSSRFMKDRPFATVLGAIKFIDKH